MSISLIVTRGYGNGTLTGTIADVVTRGYTIGDAVIVAPDLYARWNTIIEITPKFLMEAESAVNFRDELEIKPNFDGKIDG